MSDNLAGNKEFAWKKFVSTGNIYDYIKYCTSKNSNFGYLITPNGGGNACEKEYQGNSDKGN